VEQHEREQARDLLMVDLGRSWRVSRIARGEVDVPE